MRTISDEYKAVCGVRVRHARQRWLLAVAAAGGMDGDLLADVRVRIGRLNIRVDARLALPRLPVEPHVQPRRNQLPRLDRLEGMRRLKVKRIAFFARRANHRLIRLRLRRHRRSRHPKHQQHRHTDPTHPHSLLQPSDDRGGHCGDAD